VGIGRLGGIEKAAEAAVAGVAPASQHRKQFIWQIPRCGPQTSVGAWLTPERRILLCQWWWEDPGLRVEGGQGMGQAPLHCAPRSCCRQP
jgi:hypothetical protein